MRRCDHVLLSDRRVSAPRFDRLELTCPLLSSWMMMMMMLLLMLQSLLHHDGNGWAVE